MDVLSIGIAVLLVLIFITLLYSIFVKKKDAVVWPPVSYMKEAGGKCPDYWTYLGTDTIKQQTVCKNTYNVPINKTTHATCMNPPDNIFRFENYTSWPPKGEALYGRCRWIQGCGERPKLEGSWIGMDKLCSDAGDIPDEPTKYGCDGNICKKMTNGKYETQAECMTECKTYNCDKSKGIAKCTELGYGEKGKYNTKAECVYECTSGNTNYKCDRSIGGDNCIPDPNGKYTTRAECVSECRTYKCDKSNAKCSKLGYGEKGKYNTKAGCVSECTSGNTNYKCYGGKCIPDPNGIHKTRAECVSECPGPSPNPGKDKCVAYDPNY